MKYTYQCNRCKANYEGSKRYFKEEFNEEGYNKALIDYNKELTADKESKKREVKYKEEYNNYLNSNWFIRLVTTQVNYSTFLLQRDSEVYDRSFRYVRKPFKQNYINSMLLCAACNNETTHNNKATK